MFVQPHGKPKLFDLIYHHMLLSIAQCGTEIKCIRLLCQQAQPFCKYEQSTSILYTKVVNTLLCYGPIQWPLSMAMQCCIVLFTQKYSQRRFALCYESQQECLIHINIKRKRKTNKAKTIGMLGQLRKILTRTSPFFRDYVRLDLTVLLYRDRVRFEAHKRCVPLSVTTQCLISIVCAMSFQAWRMNRWQTRQLILKSNKLSKKRNNRYKLFTINFYRFQLGDLLLLSSSNQRFIRDRWCIVKLLNCNRIKCIR